MQGTLKDKVRSIWKSYLVCLRRYLLGLLKATCGSPVGWIFFGAFQEKPLLQFVAALYLAILGLISKYIDTFFTISKKYS